MKRNICEVRKRENFQQTAESHQSPKPSHVTGSYEGVDNVHFTESTLFCYLILFRIVNALIIRTFFVPDEFWQGPEVAHRIVYGYGYLTWEWYEGIRGWTPPLIYAASYTILSLFRMDNVTTLIHAPRLIQACFAAFGDLFLYKLAVKRFNHTVGKWTLLCYLMSWFVFFSVTRTLTNSLETVFSTIGLYFWPFGFTNKSDNIQILKSLGFAALSCIMRPTAAIIWIALCGLHFFSSSNKLSFVTCITLAGVLAIVWSFVVDSWLYGRQTFVQLNFLYFNVVKNIGTFYGSHPWHWYFTQGFPIIMFTHLIPFTGGIIKAFPREKSLAWLILWTILVYSFLGHKEFRFILPVIPLAMCYCGLFLSHLSGYPLEKNPATIRDNNSDVAQSGWKSRLMVIFLAITNIPVALYTTTVHQRGTIDVMDYIRLESSQVKSDEDMSVLFLMPCHSTPFYSFVHRNISMRFLECPPSDEEDYVDEADVFFLNPSAWLATTFGNVSESQEQVHLPSHIVFYDVLLPSISSFLENFLYNECARYFHTHFPTEERIGRNTLVYCKS